MTWAAYAFISEEGADRTQVSEGDSAGWEAVVQESLPLLASEEDPLLAIVSSAADIQFREVEELGAVISFPQGRVFGALGELRWRPWCRGRYLLLLTDAQTDLASLQEIGFEDAMVLDSVSEESASYLLWGELEGDGKWRDGRIPRDLTYPIDKSKDGELAWLKVKRYVDNAGVVQFARYFGVTTEGREPS